MMRRPGQAPRKGQRPHFRTSKRLRRVGHKQRGRPKPEKTYVSHWTRLLLGSVLLGAICERLQNRIKFAVAIFGGMVTLHICLCLP